MKLRIESGPLAAALAAIVRIVERRANIPVLCNVALKAHGGLLHLTTTDLDMSATVTVDAEVETGGETTAPAVALNDILRKTDGGAGIVIEAMMDRAARLRLASGRTEFFLPTLPAGDFPGAIRLDPAAEFALPAADLARLFARTAFAISTEEARYYLNGVHLVIDRTAGDGPVLYAVATDGHRLAEMRIDAPAGSETMPAIIVPRKTVAEVQRLAENAPKGAAIEIAVSDRAIRMATGRTEIASKLIEGIFPDWRRVVPRGNERIATVDGGALLAAVGRVATVAPAGRAVRLDFGGGAHASGGTGIALSVTDTESGGEARDEIDAGWTGEEFVLGINGRYLADALAVLGAGELSIAMSDPGSPALLRNPGDNSFLVVLMPMRV